MILNQPQTNFIMAFKFRMCARIFKSWKKNIKNIKKLLAILSKKNKKIIFFNCHSSFHLICSNMIIFHFFFTFIFFFWFLHVHMRMYVYYKIYRYVVRWYFRKDCSLNYYHHHHHHYLCKYMVYVNILHLYIYLSYFTQLNSKFWTYWDSAINAYPLPTLVAMVTTRLCATHIGAFLSLPFYDVKKPLPHFILNIYIYILRYIVEQNWKQKMSKVVVESATCSSIKNTYGWTIIHSTGPLHAPQKPPSSLSTKNYTCVRN